MRGNLQFPILQTIINSVGSLDILSTKAGKIGVKNINKTNHKKYELSEDIADSIGKKNFLEFSRI